MKIFIDSADIDEIEKSYATSIVDGVTTNPSLLKKAIAIHKKGKGRTNIEEYITELLLIAKGTPVSLEVTKIDADGMIKEGLELYQKFNPLSNNVVIKIPVCTSLTGKTKNFEGLKAIRALSHSRVPVNCTLVLTPEQAVLAAKAGATYVSLFTGRVDDFIRTEHGIKFNKEDYYSAEGYVHNGKKITDNGILSGVDLISKCVTIFKNYNLKAQLIAASIRNARQFREIAIAGAHIATLPFEILQSIVTHQKTIEGIKNFSKDVPAEYVKLTQGKK